LISSVHRYIFKDERFPVRVNVYNPLNLANLDTLTQINLDDLVTAFGWQAQPAARRALRWLFLSPARKFARQMVEFDSAVGELGLVNGSIFAQKFYVNNLTVYQKENIPPGPFLALSNHPGMTDTLSLFCSLSRRDLKIIALQRPFLEALPNVEKHLFYVSEDPLARFALVRRVSAHLRAGGAALTFPAGRIEPDPDVQDGASSALQTWTDSAGVFIRLAPEAALLPVLVRGVVWAGAARSPLISFKKAGEERDRLAAALQLLVQVLWGLKPVSVRVQIGSPIYAKDVGTTDVRKLHQAVLAEMKRLIDTPPTGDGEDIL